MKNQAGLNGSSRRTARINVAQVTEREQKYHDPDCVNPHTRLRQWKKHVMDRLDHQKRLIKVVEFNGVDYYWQLLHHDGSLTYARYRTGKPVNGEITIKWREKGATITRGEVKLAVVPATSFAQAEAFMAAMARPAQSVTKAELHVRGSIRYYKVPRAPRRKMEVVVYLGTNRSTGVTKCVAEIEAHGFQEEGPATEQIRQYQRLLCWSPFCTDLCMFELLME